MLPRPIARFAGRAQRALCAGRGASGALAMACCVWAGVPDVAHAALQPLTEAGLRAAYAQADQPVPDVLAALQQLSANNGLGRLFQLAGAVPEVQSGAAFAQEWAQRAGQPLPLALHDGLSSVTRLGFQGAPFDVSLDLSELLLPSAANGANRPHLGWVTLQQVNMSRSVVWVWTH